MSLSHNIEELTGRTIGAAIEVHRNMGAGLLESSYEEPLYFELEQLDIPSDTYGSVT